MKRELYSTLYSILEKDNVTIRYALKKVEMLFFCVVKIDQYSLNHLCNQHDVVGQDDIARSHSRLQILFLITMIQCNIVIDALSQI